MDKSATILKVMKFLWSNMQDELYLAQLAAKEEVRIIRVLPLLLGKS